MIESYLMTSSIGHILILGMISVAEFKQFYSYQVDFISGNIKVDSLFIKFLNTGMAKVAKNTFSMKI